MRREGISKTSDPVARGQAELVADGEHLRRVVLDGVLRAEVSLDIMTADFKAMLVPTPGVSQAGRRGQAPSIVEHLVRLAGKGVEVRLLHAGVPSGPALRELKKRLPGLKDAPGSLVIRRCPRLHAKAVIVDACAMYLGSANLTGAGLGAKSDDRRNFEVGIWTHASPMIDAALARFNALWEGACCQGCKRKDLCPESLEEPRL